MGRLICAVLLTIFPAISPLAQADGAGFDFELTNCGLGDGLCTPGPYGTVGLTLDGTSIVVNVKLSDGFVIFGTGGAFAFNIVPDTDIKVTSLTPGFSFGDSNGVASPDPTQFDGFGRFDFIVDGPTPPQGVQELSFRAERVGAGVSPFASVWELVQLSTGSNTDNGQPSVFFAAHLAPAEGGTGFAGAVAAIPEPQSAVLALAGLGMLAAGACRRRKRTR